MRIKLCFLLLLLLLACSPLREEESAPEQTVCLDFSPPPADTKSLYTESDLNILKTIIVYGVDETGFWKRAATARNGSVQMSFPAGRTVTFYVMANMPGELPVDKGGKLQPELFEYMLPETSGFALTGVPMAAKTSVTLPAGGGRTLSLRIPLERLVAKVVVHIDKSALTGGLDVPVLASDYVCVRRANLRMRPFAADGSRAVKPRDLYDDRRRLFDVDRFTVGGTEMEHSDIVLYVPENRQGVHRTLTSAQESLCTYLEYSAGKDGTDDGVSGPLCYRAYLGGNVADDYSVRRNSVYRATLSLTWDGLMWKADGWRIDTDDLTDSRRLVLSLDNESAEAVSGNSLGKIHRDDYKEVYVNFSRDGGSSWLHGLKDLDDWPYGWDLYIDGVKQTAGEYGVAASDIEWDYYSGSGTSTTDLISIYPGTNSVTRSTHTLQVRSADGKVSSNIVRFDIGGKPLGLFWSGKAPQYIAQRGMLSPDDLESSSATVVYTVINGADKVRLSSAGFKNSTMVNIVGSGTVTIQAVCEATDQDDEITFTVQAPQLSLGASAYYANPDGGEAKTGTTGISGSSVTASYSGASGTLTQRSTAATATAVGTYLAADLYDELLAFTPTVDSPLLETSCASGYGTVALHTKALTSGSVTYPAAAGAAIGTVTVSSRDASIGVTPATATVRSVNPFSMFPSTVTVNNSKDIQDFSVIGYSDSGQTWGYANSTYYATIPRVNATSTYVGFDAYMNDETTSEPTLSTLFSKASGGRVTWKSVTTERVAIHTAGVFSLKVYVANQYSGERLYSPVFYKGRLFRHGAVEAFMRPEDSNYGKPNTAEVSARYYVMFDRNYSLNRADYYPSDGLGCAFPDVGTHRTDETIEIDWSDYEMNMIKHPGSLTIVVNSDPRSVCEPETDWLYSVHDDCCEAHQYLEVTECHEGWSGIDPKMYFCTAGDDSKYKNGSIKRINENLVYLHPDGAPTTTVSGYTVGYFVLHTTKYVADLWL